MTPIQIVIIAVITAGLAALMIRAVVTRRRARPMDLNENGEAFEDYLAALLEGCGFTEIGFTSRSGDYGADLLAEKEDVTYAIQCKYYDGPVGVKAVQEAIGGRIFYHRHVGVVATNNYFTQNAREMAERAGIILWDRDKMIAMEERAGVK